MLTISVILAIKNGEEYIKYLDHQFDKIELLYKEKYEFEYFILENNSTDKTKDYIRQFFFNRCRKGNFFMEDLNNNLNFSKEINKTRGEYMAFLRNKLKKCHGTLNSDYTLLIDCDIIFSSNIIEKMINIFNEYVYYVGPSDKNIKKVILPTNPNIVFSKPINSQKKDWNDKFQLNVDHGNNILNIKRIDSEEGWGQQLELLVKPLASIAAVSVFDSCISNSASTNDHYYDSLAMITNKNISYLNNNNTCMFLNCDRCINVRKHLNICLNDNLLLPRNNVFDVNSAFGGFFLLKTEIYNNVQWEGSICEHHSFCKNIKKFGNILIEPRLKIYHVEYGKYMEYHQKLFG